MGDLSSHASEAKSNLLLISLVAAVFGYLLPWVVAPSAPMTLGAYDLAEWLSLHPSQHHTSPPLQAVLFLRLQLVLLSLMLGAVSANKPWRLVSAIVIVLLAIGQLPPPEFIKDLGNINYRQQFALALTSLIAGLLLLYIRHSRLRSIVLVVLPLAGTLTVVAGVSQALGVFTSLHANGTVGLGVWIFVASYVACFASTVIAGAWRARTHSRT